MHKELGGDLDALVPDDWDGTFDARIWVKIERGKPHIAVEPRGGIRHDGKDTGIAIENPKHNPAKLVLELSGMLGQLVKEHALNKIIEYATNIGPASVVGRVDEAGLADARKHVSAYVRSDGIYVYVHNIEEFVKLLKR